jgi:hypothetical protein
MAKSSSQPASKLTLWMNMLLIWNIALLCVALFFLWRIMQHPFSVQEIADACVAYLTPLQE